MPGQFCVPLAGPIIVTGRGFVAKGSGENDEVRMMSDEADFRDRRKAAREGRLAVADQDAFIDEQDWNAIDDGVEHLPVFAKQSAIERLFDRVAGAILERLSGHGSVETFDERGVGQRKFAVVFGTAKNGQKFRTKHAITQDAAIKIHFV